MALLETLQRCSGDPTSFRLRVYQNAEPQRVHFVHAQCTRCRMALNDVPSDPTVTNKDTVALLYPVNEHFLTLFFATC